MNRKTLVFFMILAGYAGVALLGYISRPKQTIQIPPEIIQPVVKCTTDPSSFEGTDKKLGIIANKPSNGSGGNLRGYKVTLARTGLTSDVACGYLMYQVSFGGKPVEQESMALYMRPTGSQLGGHIWPDENRGAVIKTVENKTQVIMPLDAITYDDTAKYPIKQANWASLLNVSDHIEFEVALSADVPNGRIDLVQLAYKCKNKDSGKEDDVCLLEVVKTEPFGF